MTKSWNLGDPPDLARIPKRDLKKIKRDRIKAAKVEGCTCDPDIYLRLGWKDGKWGIIVGASHEIWCSHPGNENQPSRN